MANYRDGLSLAGIDIFAFYLELRQQLDRLLHQEINLVSSKRAGHQKNTRTGRMFLRLLSGLRSKRVILGVLLVLLLNSFLLAFLLTDDTARETQGKDENRTNHRNRSNRKYKRDQGGDLQHLEFHVPLGTALAIHSFLGSFPAMLLILTLRNAN